MFANAIYAIDEGAVRTTTHVVFTAPTDTS
jgi:hypothetical protein